MTRNSSMVIRAARATTIVLAPPLAWRAAAAAADAVAFRSAAVVASYIGVTAVLIGSVVALDVSTRRYGLVLSRVGAPLFASSCALSLAIGNYPGYLSSLPFVTIVITFVALFAAFVSGPRPGSAPRFAAIVFAAAVGAAWQIAVVPVIAILIIRE